MLTGPSSICLNWAPGRALLLCLQPPLCFFFYFKSNLAIKPSAEHWSSEIRVVVIVGALSQAGDRAMLMRHVALCWGHAECCGHGPQTTARYCCWGGKVQAEIQIPALFVPRGQVSNRDVPSSSVPI